MPERSPRVGGAPAPGRPSPLLLGLGWPSGDPGGANRYLADLLAALAADGDDARAIVVGPAPDAPVTVVAVADHAAPLPSRILRFALATRRAAAETSVVDVHFALYAALPLRLWLRRKPVVVHFHGPWAAEGRAEGGGAVAARAQRAIERSTYRRAVRLVTVSSAFKQVLVEGYRVSPWSVRVIPPGVDSERFSPGDRAEARARLGLPEGAAIVMAARRLVVRTGVPVLLDAWTSVVSPGGTTASGDPLLVLVGDGPQRALLEERCAARGLTGSVRFLGRVPEADLADCYRAADVSVVPSIALEGFGLSALESLACGTPVIVTEVGGLPEVVAGLDRSLVVPAADAGALAARITAALSGDLPSTSSCRDHALGFSWSAAARRHRGVYEPAPGDAMRVVYLDHTARMSGGELALLRLVPFLPGVEPHVILGEDGPLAARLREAGVSCEVLELDPRAREVRRGSVRPGRFPLSGAILTTTHVLRLARRLRSLGPALVHTNSLKAAVYGGFAGRLAGVPVVWHVRDRIDRDYLPGTAVRVLRALARRVPSGIIANSAATLTALGAGLPPTAVIPSPVDVDGISGRSGERQAGGGPVRVGMVGRLAPWKGQDTFLRAFAAAFGDGTSRAVIAGSALFGEDEYATGLRSLADDLGIADRVDFLGFRDDVAGVLAELDVMVHASVIPEPFGQVVVEGMAAGLPVIATRAGGPAELLDDAVSGFLYEPGDVDGLAALLRRLGHDPALRAEIGGRARERAWRFAPREVAPLVAAFYAEVTGRSSSG